MASSTASEDHPLGMVTGREAGEPQGQPFPLLVRQVEVVQQPPGLLGDRRDDRRVSVADIGHRKAGQHVHVFLAVGVPDQRPRTARDHGRAVEQREPHLPGRLAAHLLAQDLLATRAVRRALDPLH
jgi:hypothetical protein